jgi:hypothetical protein
MGVDPELRKKRFEYTTTKFIRFPRISHSPMLLAEVSTLGVRDELVRFDDFLCSWSWPAPSRLPSALLPMPHGKRSGRPRDSRQHNHTAQDAGCQDTSSI